jgi:hypothetical protein
VPLAPIPPVAAATAALAVLLLTFSRARLAARAGGAALEDATLLLRPALGVARPIFVAGAIFVPCAIFVARAVLVPRAILMPRTPLFAGTELITASVPFAALAAPRSLRAILPGRALPASAVRTVAAERPPL